MSSCKLYIKNLGQPSQFYEVVFDKRTVGGPTVKTAHSDFNRIIEFAESYGVKGSEMLSALEYMEEKYHDVADFGIMGSFMFSEYKGTVQ